MGNEPVAASFASTGTAGTLLLSSYLDRTNERIRNAFDLRPSEGVMIDLRGDEPVL
jgi:hypothetical protein